MKKIKIRVSPNGEEVIIDAIGFKGKACDLATKDLIKLLSQDRSVKKKTKPEYNINQNKETI